MDRVHPALIRHPLDIGDPPRTAELAKQQQRDGQTHQAGKEQDQWEDNAMHARGFLKIKTVRFEIQGSCPSAQPHPLVAIGRSSLASCRRHGLPEQPRLQNDAEQQPSGNSGGRANRIAGILGSGFSPANPDRIARHRQDPPIAQGPAGNARARRFPRQSSQNPQRKNRPSQAGQGPAKGHVARPKSYHDGLSAHRSLSSTPLSGQTKRASSPFGICLQGRTARVAASRSRPGRP